MIPDLATLRDRATSRRWQVIYGVLALGWRNSARHWHRYESAYLLLGGLATPLVVSVHSVVSSDFAISMMPGWHETVFPPYFVAGAIFSGFAMVLLLCIPLRLIYRLQDFITDRPPGGDGQDRVGHELPHVVRLLERAVPVVVRPRERRALRLLEPLERLRPVRRAVVDRVCLQHLGAAVVLDPPAAAQPNRRWCLYRWWCCWACGSSAT